MAARAWWIAAAIGAALTAGCFDFAATSDGVRSDGGDATSSTDGGGGADATTDAADGGSKDAAPADAVGETDTGADAESFCASFVAVRVVGVLLRGLRARGRSRGAGRPSTRPPGP